MHIIYVLRRGKDLYSITKAVIMALGNHEFTGLTAVLRRVLDRWARNKLQTSMPGTVFSYDSSAQTVSVTPDVGDGTRLDDVPVLFPGTKGRHAEIRPCRW